MRAGVRGDRRPYKWTPKATRRNRVFKVYLTIPDGVSEDRVMDYIEDAVCAHKGGLHPEDPIRDLDVDTVCVKRTTPKYNEMENKYKGVDRTSLEDIKPSHP